MNRTQLIIVIISLSLILIANSLYLTGKRINWDRDWSAETKEECIQRTIIECGIGLLLGKTAHASIGNQEGIKYLDTCDKAREVGPSSVCDKPTNTKFIETVPTYQKTEHFIKTAYLTVLVLIVGGIGFLLAGKSKSNIA